MFMRQGGEPFPHKGKYRRKVFVHHAVLAATDKQKMLVHPKLLKDRFCSLFAMRAWNSHLRQKWLSRVLHICRENAGYIAYHYTGLVESPRVETNHKYWGSD